MWFQSMMIECPTPMMRVVVQSLAQLWAGRPCVVRAKHKGAILAMLGAAHRPPLTEKVSELLSYCTSVPGITPCLSPVAHEHAEQQQIIADVDCN